MAEPFLDVYDCLLYLKGLTLGNDCTAHDLTMNSSKKTTDQSALFAVDNRADPLCVIIPAHNEEGYIGACLEALLEQNDAAGPVNVVVAANACTDQTEIIARAQETRFAARGWTLKLSSTKTPGKLNALNVAEQHAIGSMRVYLDADVICDPDLLGQLRVALNKPEPVYATGTLQVMPAKSWITRAYANLWVRLPFITDGTVGAGLFSINAAGRKRWKQFPDIISDDTFVRLNFRPDERIEVPALYHWPMVEGFRNLVAVRHRQDAGVAEISRLYPQLKENDVKRKLPVSELLKLFLAAPFSFIIYAIVHYSVRLRRGSAEWKRGR